MAAELGRNPRPASKVEVDLIADNQAASSGGMQVAAVPVARLLGTGQKGGAVGAVPVNTVAAVGQRDVGDLGKASLFADLVGRPAMDEPHTQHKALVTYPFDAIQLRLVAKLGVG